jgi:hypothetical protein
MVRHERSAGGILDSILGLVAGLVLTFAGYRLARGVAALAGFIAGFVVGLLLGGVVAGPVGALVGAILLGILFAILFALAFRLVGGVLGAVVAYAVAIALAWPLWVAILLALAGAVVGLLVNKPAIVVATALAGAWLAVTSAVELLYDAGMQRLGNEALDVGIATIVLAAIGAAVQLRSLRYER